MGCARLIEAALCTCISQRGQRRGQAVSGACDVEYLALFGSALVLGSVRAMSAPRGVCCLFIYRRMPYTWLWLYTRP